MVESNKADGDGKGDQAFDSASKGRKVCKVLGSRFEIPVHYEIIDPVGSGAYGVVAAVKDTSE